MDHKRRINWPLGGTPLTIFGDGSQTRSFCFVTDIGAMCLAALTLLAIYLPARRAMRVDPLIALSA